MVILREKPNGKEIAGDGVLNFTILEHLCDASDGNACVRDPQDESKQGWARRYNLIDIAPGYRPQRNLLRFFLQSDLIPLLLDIVFPTQISTSRTRIDSTTGPP